MSVKLFGIEFSPEEITIDETGKVIINNPQLAEAVKNAATTDIDVRSRRRRPVIVNNCDCPGGGDGPPAM